VLNLEAPEPIVAQNVRFGISLVTRAGVEFVSFDSASNKADFRLVQQRGVLRCRIPTLPVIRGQYRGWIYAGINGVVADRVEDAFEVEVTGGEYPKMGFFAVPHDWSIADGETNTVLP
jgi:hypothetical protein